MKQKKTFVTLLLVVALLCLGIGYAAITDVTLTVSGNAGASADDANFQVYFDTESAPTTSKTNTKSSVTASYQDSITAKLNCSALSTKDDEVSATYTVLNESPELTAYVSAAVQSTHSYFDVTTTWDKTEIAAGGNAKVTVKVKLKSTISGADVSEPVTIKLTASATKPTT